MKCEVCGAELSAQALEANSCLKCGAIIDIDAPFKDANEYKRKAEFVDSIQNLMNANYDMGIFEAGISEPDEMMALQDIIRPTIGVFTNIGQAHECNRKESGCGLRRSNRRTRSKRCGSHYADYFDF